MTSMSDKVRGEIKHNEPLYKHTTWHVGGLARQTFRPADTQDLRLFLSQLPKTEPILWLGLGSNVLIRDAGFPGTVIFTQYGLNSLKIHNNMIEAECGVTCAKLARFCADQGFSQGEFFAGIPGTIGGALAMNAGAFGGETWNYVVAVETIDHSGELHSRKPSDYHVGYRTVESMNKNHEEWFTRAQFSFPVAPTSGDRASIKTLLAKRAETQPIGTFNCGSVFRNPPGDYAARLIEASGLKGYRNGGAVVSEKHANFIINDQHARAADIEALIIHVQQEVIKKQGITLHLEVKIVGM